MEGLKEMQEAATKSAERMDAIEGKLDTVIETLAKPAEKPPAEKPKQRITALEDVTNGDEGEGPKPMGNTHQELLDACRGFRTT